MQKVCNESVQKSVRWPESVQKICKKCAGPAQAQVRRTFCIFSPHFQAAAHFLHAFVAHFLHTFCILLIISLIRLSPYTCVHLCKSDHPVKEMIMLWNLVLTLLWSASLAAPPPRRSFLATAFRAARVHGPSAKFHARPLPDLPTVPDLNL